MAQPLNAFLTKLSTNQMRTANMFELSFTFDGTLDSEIANVFAELPPTMYCEGFELPDRTTQFAEVAYKGYPVPVPTITTMGQTHQITVRADVDGSIRRAFLALQSATCDMDIGGDSVFEGNRRLDGTGIINISLSLLGNDMSTIVETYKLHHVRVENVGAISMSNSASPGIVTFPVSFKSVYWSLEEAKNGHLKSIK